MQPILVNHVWKLVERTPESQLLGLSDRALTDWLSDQLSKQQDLTVAETETVKAYIRSRLILIREMALAESS
ncbi:MAG: hypothetical protein HC768_21170 [Acaryochloris sp. CRU_2_0]|nr:hypothetical protein [Acaryochloris sp. CRU_2_0]